MSVTVQKLDVKDAERQCRSVIGSLKSLQCRMLVEAGREPGTCDSAKCSSIMQDAVETVRRQRGIVQHLELAAGGYEAVAKYPTRRESFNGPVEDLRFADDYLGYIEERVGSTPYKFETFEEVLEYAADIYHDIDWVSCALARFVKEIGGSIDGPRQRKNCNIRLNVARALDASHEDYEDLPDDHIRFAEYSESLDGDMYHVDLVIARHLAGEDVDRLAAFGAEVNRVQEYAPGSNVTCVRITGCNDAAFKPDVPMSTWGWGVEYMADEFPPEDNPWIKAHMDAKCEYVGQLFLRD